MITSSTWSALDFLSHELQQGCAIDSTSTYNDGEATRWKEYEPLTDFMVQSVMPV